MKATNIPEVRLGIVAVSRDCFPIALSTRRRQNIVTACKTKGFEPMSAASRWKTRPICSRLSRRSRPRAATP